MRDQGMLHKIDSSQLPNLQNIDAILKEKMTYDPNMDWSVPYYWGAAGIAVNTAKVPDYERSWSIFSRKDLAGKMTLLDDMRDVFGAALSSLDFSVNSTDPAQIEAAASLIKTQWQPNIVRFDSEGFGKGYARGDFWVVQSFSEGIFDEIESNEKLVADTVFFIPPEGGSAYIDCMCILKDAKNVALALEFINFIHRPEIYADFCDTFGFPSGVNVPARAFKKVKPWYTVEDLAHTELTQDIGEAIDYYNDAWFEDIRVGS
jgi:spermidine/putrescine transport system substrate-binding protein